jgi:hypothetical protein
MKHGRAGQAAESEATEVYKSTHDRDNDLPNGDGESMGDECRIVEEGKVRHGGEDGVCDKGDPACESKDDQVARGI